MCCLTLLDGGVPVDGMTECLLDTFGQTFVCNEMRCVVPPVQFPTLNVLPQFGVDSVFATWASAEVVFPGRSTGCQQSHGDP